MRLDVGSGSYAFRCLFEDYDPITGPTVTVGGHARGAAAILPVTGNDLIGPAKQYHAYVAAGPEHAGQPDVDAVTATVRGGNLGAAKTAWLTAHLTYERLGAAYDAFGDYDDEIDGAAGRAGGRGELTPVDRLLPAGVRPVARAERAAADRRRRHAGPRRARAARLLARPLRSTCSTSGLRTHEILENALEFQLTGHDDYGSGSTLATTQANITGTHELLTILHPLLRPAVRRAARRLHLAEPAAEPAQSAKAAGRDMDAGRPAER